MFYVHDQSTGCFNIQGKYICPKKSFLNSKWLHQSAWLQRKSNQIRDQSFILMYGLSLSPNLDLNFKPVSEKLLYTLKNKRIRLYSKTGREYALIFDLRLLFTPLNSPRYSVRFVYPCKKLLTMRPTFLKWPISRSVFNTSSIQRTTHIVVSG